MEGGVFGGVKGCWGIMGVWGANGVFGVIGVWGWGFEGCKGVLVAYWGV